MDDQKIEKIIKYGTIVAVLGLATIVVVLFLQVKLPVIGKPSNWLVSGGLTLTEIEETEEENICDDMCYYKKALQNATYCDYIKNESVKEDCYEKWVDESLDYCLKVKGNIREECIYYHAKKNDNIDICRNAINRSACMLYVDDCYSYEDNTEKGRCFAFKRKNYTYCLDDLCYFDFALSINEKEICNMISSPARKTACVSIIEKNDRCTELNVPAEKDLCWQLYAIESKDSAVCFRISKVSRYALNCFAYYAAKMKDLSFCDASGFVLDDLWKCYRIYSLESGDLTGCDLIYNKSLGYATTNIYACYAEYAKKYGNPAACNGIRDLSQMRTCYEGSILGKTNIDYTKCADIQLSIWKNKCYTEYAKYNNDPTKCDYITTNKEEREACYIAWRVYNNVTSS
ncbi:MAG: hypothetical protein QXF70_02175 [Candidatus Bilamarchaeaceae archaeon]